ncbi:hypothetical protein WDV93_24870 [Pantoea ananatis]
MSFTPKNLTQGGQITAYRLRMFIQVNQWISHWMLLFFVLTTLDFVLVHHPGRYATKRLLVLDGLCAVGLYPADAARRPARVGYPLALRTRQNMHH